MLRCWNGASEDVTLTERLSEDDCRNLTMWMIRVFALYAVGMPLVALGVYGGLPSAAAMHGPDDDEYGWFILGNKSLATDYAMDMRWANQTDSVPYVWTPPPEWREHCIRSYGAPMSACSYFSAQEDPDFMTRFYLAYFVLAGLIALNRIIIFVVYPLREFICCLKLNRLHVFSPQYLQPIGPEIVRLPGWYGYELDVVTPVEKISMMRRLKMRGCTEERAFHLLLPLVHVSINWCIFYDDLYAAFGPGMGLVHSRGTGLPYLGAGWASDPLPHTSQLAPLHWSAIFLEMYIPRLLLYVANPANGAWQTAFSSEWGFMLGTTCVTFPIKWIMIKRILEASTVMSIVKMEREAAASKKAAATKAREEANPSAPQTRTASEASIEVPIKVKRAPRQPHKVRYPERFSCGEYLRWFFVERGSTLNGGIGSHDWTRLFFDPIVSWITIHFIFGETTLAFSQFITWYAGEGQSEEGTRTWFVTMHAFCRISIFTWPLNVCFMLMLKRQLIKASGLIELRMSRGDTRFQALMCEWSKWTGLLVYCLGVYVIWVLVLPNGLFMQVFGVKDAFPNGGPNELYTGADAAPATAGANLLVTPKIRLAMTVYSGVWEIFLLFPFFKWSIMKPKSYKKYQGGRR